MWRLYCFLFGHKAPTHWHYAAHIRVGCCPRCWATLFEDLDGKRLRGSTGVLHRAR